MSPEQLSQSATSTPRPLLVRVARIALAVVLMPFPLLLLAFPIAFFAGYRLHKVEDSIMAPAYPRGSYVVLAFGPDIDIVRGRVYGVRLGSTSYGPVIALRRVVAVPGDEARIDRGRVWVNGTMADEPYVATDSRDLKWPRPEAPNGSTTEQTPPPSAVVPEGEVLVMGDRRDLAMALGEPRSVALADLVANVVGAAK